MVNVYEAPGPFIVKEIFIKNVWFHERTFSGPGRRRCKVLGEMATGRLAADCFDLVLPRAIL